MIGLWRRLDIREGEGPLAVGAFAVLLMVISAHAMLETARDAMFLAKLPVRDLAFVYIAVAALALFVGPATTALSRRLGARRALTVSLFAAAAAPTGLFFVRNHPSAVFALYVTSGLLGSVLVPQFWATLAGRLTVAQARRLFSPIAGAGVIGGLVGSGIAAIVVSVLPVAALLLVAAALFVATAIGTLLTPRTERRPPAVEVSAGSVFRDEPFLKRIGLLVILSTSTVLVLDYLFKLRVARVVPAAELGAYFAQFYTGMNALAIIVQLFASGALIRRMGVATAVGFTPLLLLFGSVGTLFSGGAILAVLAAKAADGALRHSVQRVSTELLYLPVPAPARERAKPILDGAVARGAQGITAIALFSFAELGVGTGRVVTLLLAWLSLGWFAVAISIRKPYLNLFRRALSVGAVDPGEGDGLDLSTAEVLIERLSSIEPRQVVAAMDVLAARGRGGLIPALVLHHTDVTILRRALEIFGESDRIDWAPLAGRLLAHSDETVRDAALRALATHGASEAIERAAGDESPRVRAYAIVCLAARGERRDLLRDERVRGLVANEDVAARSGVLAAIADLGSPRSTVGLLRSLAQDPLIDRTPELVQKMAAAIATSADPAMIPWLLRRLDRAEGRDAVRAALVKLGDPAEAAVADALRDETTPRRLRVHLPRTLSAFATQSAADLLLQRVDTDPDGLVRYKALRGLGRLCEQNEKVHLDRRAVEALAYRNLVEHLRLLALHAFVEDDPSEPRSRLLRGLLEDKLQQSLERVFRLLNIAHREEDLRRVHDAALGADTDGRANAAEFLDAFLTLPDQGELRSALRIVIDDLPADERVLRAASALPTPAPKSHGEAITMLVEDADLMLATLATEYAERHGDESLLAEVQRARTSRVGLLESGLRFFSTPTAKAENA